MMEELAIKGAIHATFIFSRIRTAKVQALSKSLIDKLQLTMSCPNAGMIFEHVYTAFYPQGEGSRRIGLLRCYEFSHGQQTQERVAAIVIQRVPSK
nr:DUF1904 family protein [Vibrio neptunius]